jgi:hypothetical protein
VAEAGLLIRGGERMGRRRSHLRSKRSIVSADDQPGSVNSPTAFASSLRRALRASGGSPQLMSLPPPISATMLIVQFVRRPVVS